MDVFQSSKKYTPHQLAKLNTCRRFLKAATVSDIATADGKRLCPGVHLGERPCQDFNCYQWPRQPPQLNSQHWELWKQALQETLHTPYSTSNILRRPLGDWLVEPEPTWDWHFNASSATLYQRVPSGWQTFTPSKNVRRGTKFHRTARIETKAHHPTHAPQMSNTIQLIPTISS